MTGSSDSDDDRDDDDCDRDGHDDRDRDDDCGDGHHPRRDGLIFGTAGNDLIDASYRGDPDGDRVDAFDAIIRGDGPNDDRIYAGSGDDTIRSGLGNDTIDGGIGNDRIYGGPGSDFVLGQDGNDLIDTQGDYALPDRGYPGLYPSDSKPYDDRDTVYGGNGNDTIRTGDDRDLIYGGDGNDSIDGGFDDDLIYGGKGNDTIVGGEGSDCIDAGSGDDLIYGGLGPDVPDAVNIPDAAGDKRPDNGRDYILAGQGNDTVYGLDDDDTIYGGTGEDLIYGGVDDDLIYGDSGNDLLTGGEGADRIFGGADRDTIYVTLSADGRGDVIDGGEEGDDFDTLDLRGAGPLRIAYAPDNRENGTVSFLDDSGEITGTLTFKNIENIMPCFTPGTLIATPKGELLVENLRPGDKIITRDNGIQEIAWVGSRHMDWAALCANPHLKPVLIPMGSLGHGLPERDTLVSPNHRMLVTNDRTALYFEDHEVLVAAKHLVSGKHIHAVDAAGTTYIHFMFARHEVVLANGAWTESFQPGDFTLKGMGNAQRTEIFELFPELRSAAGLAGYTAARRTLKRHEARLLTER